MTKNRVLPASNLGEVHLAARKTGPKVTIAGGAVYVAYDSGLLGNSEQGSEALRKAKAVIPPAMEEWMKYFGVELPTIPKIEFSLLTRGILVRIQLFAPTKATEYTSQGLQYLKDLTK
uniref:MICOS complex subunit MIC13 n=1 Tax=Maylandia zebra TaxID=106582 RepID=A0A3P9B624_9CICH